MKIKIIKILCLVLVLNIFILCVGCSEIDDASSLNSNSDSANALTSEAEVDYIEGVFEDYQFATYVDDVFVHVSGKIKSVDEYNQNLIRIEDKQGKLWHFNNFSFYDLTPFDGQSCEVYGLVRDQERFGTYKERKAGHYSIELNFSVDERTKIVFADGNVFSMFDTCTLKAKEEEPHNCYCFGNYEQNGDTSDGTEPIEWIELDTDGDKTLLMSKCILAYLPFNESISAEATDWEGSSLRAWMNSDFYNDAFSSSEKAEIVKSKVYDEWNDNYTEDNVFVLSIEQIDEYLKNDTELSASSSHYASSMYDYPGSYWTLTSYCNNLYKYSINSSGQKHEGPRVNETEGVRPVIWVQTKTLK